MQRISLSFIWAVILLQVVGLNIQVHNLEAQTSKDFLLARNIQQLIGYSDDAQNCGWLLVGANEQALRMALACGLEATKNGKPFYIVKIQKVLNPTLAIGLLSKGDGLITKFSYERIQGEIATFALETCQIPHVILAGRPGNYEPIFACRRIGN